MLRQTDKRIAQQLFGSHAGYIAARRCTPTVGPRVWVVGYVAEEQGISAEDGGKYMALCNAHSTNLQVTSRAALLRVLAAGTNEFCDCCRGTCGDYCPTCKPEAK